MIEKIDSLLLVPTNNAVGHRLAHSFALESVRYRKGLEITSIIANELVVGGILELWIFNPEVEWLDENSAAECIADVLQPVLQQVAANKPARQGRLDWFANQACQLSLSSEVLSALNEIDDAITVMSINSTWLGKSQRFLSIKVIPLFLEQYRVDRWLAEVKQIALAELIREVKFIGSGKIAIVLTTLPGVTNKLLDKTRRTAEQAFADFPYQLSFYIAKHDLVEITQTLQHLQSSVDCVLIYSASTTVTEGDIVPRSIHNVGGRILRMGLPIEPGNLCLVANIGETLLLNLPGSARSIMHPKIKQLILDSLAHETTTRQKLNQLSSGGLRQSRMLRDERKPKQRLLLLAAGLSSRYANGHKLVDIKQGQTLLERTLESIPADAFDSIHVVIAADSEYLAEFDAVLEQKSDLVSPCVISTTVGMGDSIARAVKTLPRDTDWIWILPADMPAVAEATYTLLTEEAGIATATQRIFQPTYHGNPGHPVGFHHSLKPLLQGLHADTGAKNIVRAEKQTLCQLAVTDANVTFDIDTEATYDHFLQDKQ